MFSEFFAAISDSPEASSLVGELQVSDNTTCLVKSFLRSNSVKKLIFQATPGNAHVLS